MQHILKKLVPETLKKIVQHYRGKGLQHSDHLLESTIYADIGEAGPLVKDVFSRLKDIPGFFNFDDCGHFFLVLSYQSAMEIKGDLLEIGSYHGRSTALMAKCLKPGERIVVCDAFELDVDDNYDNKPSPENLISNIQRVNREIERDRIVIHKCLSNDLHLDADEKFRFIHIDDGGEHTIRVVHPIFGEWKKTVRIGDGDTINMPVNFNDQVNIRITAFDADGKPIWAEILVDNESTGELTPKEISVRVGQRTIAAKKEGYILVNGERKLMLDKYINEPIKFIFKKAL